MLFGITAAFVFCFPLLERLEQTWIDAKFRLTTAKTNSSPIDPLLIALDTPSLEASGNPFAAWHGEFARLFRTLAELKPAAVLVDLELPTRAFASNPEGMEELAAALIQLRGVCTVLVGRGVDDTGGLNAVHPLIEAAVGPSNFGVMLWRFDTDGVVRQYSKELGVDGTVTLATLGLAALNLPPVDGYVNFSLGPKWEKASFMQLASEANGASVKSKEWAQRVSGRPVIIGVSLPFDDRVRQPISMAAWEDRATAPGMLLYAQTIRSHSQNAMIVRPTGLGFVIAVAPIIFVMLGSHKLRHCLVFLATFCVALPILSIGAMKAAIQTDIVPALLVSALLATYLLCQGFVQSFRERMRLRSIFSGYVSPAVLEEIVNGDVQTALPKRYTNLAVLFSDIRGFTSYSSRTPVEEVVKLLDDYFERMTKVIHSHGGMVDKFRGDGLMAIFGAPQQVANPALSAMSAGAEMLKELALLNAELAVKGQVAIQIGIGISSGDAIVGNIGSRERHDFTAIGEVVNIAAHIQEYCKVAKSDFLVDDRAITSAGSVSRSDSEFHYVGIHDLPKHKGISLWSFAQTTNKEDLK